MLRGLELVADRGEICHLYCHLGKPILGDYEVKDEVWATHVAEWLEQETVELTGDDIKLNRERVLLTSKSILIEAIGFKTSQVTRGDEMRVAKIMKDLGYKKRQLQNLTGKPYHWEILKNDRLIVLKKQK